MSNLSTPVGKQEQPAPVVEPTAGEVVFDPTILDAFVADLGEDGAGVRTSLYEAFLDQGADQLVTLVEAPDSEKGLILQSIAHSVRSAGASLGLVALSRAASDIETALRTAPEKLDLALTSTQLVGEFERATTVIRALLEADLQQG